MTRDITIIIPTYNRADELSETLEAMVGLEKGDLSIEFVIVDNNSIDQTKAVVDSFSGRLLPIQYLFESKPGKCRALNRAIKEARLGDIVVFTDDDVTPNKDWLISIDQICERWPNHSVFGGKIYVIFPEKDIPKWASDDFIMGFGFSYHHYSNVESPYTTMADVPFGPNFWVRRQIFSNKVRFNEKIGPRPSKRILGDETEFLLNLKNKGYEIVYSPIAVVGHRIEKDVLSVPGIIRRAYSHGRSSPYLFGLPRYKLFKKYPAFWILLQCLVILKYIMLTTYNLLTIDPKTKVRKSTRSIYNLAAHLESLRHFDKSKFNDPLI